MAWALEVPAGAVVEAYALGVTAVSLVAVFLVRWFRPLVVEAASVYRVFLWLFAVQTVGLALRIGGVA